MKCDIMQLISNMHGTILIVLDKPYVYEAMLYITCMKYNRAWIGYTHT